MGTFTFDGAEQSALVNGQTVYDTGVFQIFTYTSWPPIDVNYQQGSTPSSIALAVVQRVPACSQSGEEFSATSDGPVVTLTSCQTGSNTKSNLDGVPGYHSFPLPPPAVHQK